MKNAIFCMALALCVAGAQAQSAKTYTLHSPDGKITVDVSCGKTITYKVEKAGEVVFAPSEAAMTLTDGTVWGRDVRVEKANKATVSGVIASPVYKKASIKDEYNQLSIGFKGGYGIELRAYDDGIAYRFTYQGKAPVTVAAEQVTFNFAGDHKAFVPYVRITPRNQRETLADQFNNSFENTYRHENLSAINQQLLMFLPMVVQLPSGRSVCITEADLESYPGLFLSGTGGNSLKGVFAPYPKETVPGGHNMIQCVVTQTEDYIARIEGPRTFPWRTAVIADRDCELTDSDMVYKLAAKSRIADESWIKPGKVAWEWWNDWGVYGVDFKSGINTETYKYYIDFAAQNHIEYIILDEGWSVLKAADLYRVVPGVDLKELVEYGKRKNVGVILWAGFGAFNKDIEGISRHYAQMGIKGFKVDFVDRDDQQAVDIIYRMARATAENKLLLDLHGIYKPTGLQRTYPNVINFEGVFGLETAKWTPITAEDQVTYDVTIPFIRAVAGPMDYTQGAMRNGNKLVFNPVRSEPMSPGTRCRQLAEYVIFESPLGMMCDSPVKYRSEPECTKFIAQIPTVWDQTVALDGKIAEYVVMARRKGDVWYVGGLTDWTARTLTVDLSMLAPGTYQIELLRDGINADRYAQDYKREVLPLSADRKFIVDLAPGGGFAAIITRK